MSIIRQNILLTTLYLVDEDVLSKELILYLDKHVSRDQAITPNGLMSVCMMHWATSPKRESSAQQMRKVKDNLTNALKFAWQHSQNYRARVAKLQTNRMRGWRISEAHRLRKIAKAMNVPIK